LSLDERKAMIDTTSKLSISRQCQLLKLPRSSYYYEPKPVGDETLALMKAIDQLHLERPHMGSRQMRDRLRDQGFKVNRKKVQGLMRLMGIEAIYSRPKTSLANKAHSVYPYLLKGIRIERPNQVWVSDITYLPMQRGFCYLIAIMDLFSRKILTWRLSNSLDTRFCIETLNQALATYPKPDIFNTDQGSQFTSTEFTSILKQHDIQISMDSKGRWVDNVFIERFWKSLKYEEVYLRAYQSIPEAKHFIGNYIYDYNYHRRHSSLDHQTPDSVYNQPMESFIPTIISHNSHDFIPGPCS
jgi:putative transposase